MIAPAVAHGPDSAAASSTAAVPVDTGLVTVLKGAIWVGSLFVAIFTFIWIVFSRHECAQGAHDATGRPKRNRQMLAELKSDIEALKGPKTSWRS